MRSTIYTHTPPPAYTRRYIQIYCNTVSRTFTSGAPRQRWRDARGDDALCLHPLTTGHGSVLFNFLILLTIYFTLKFYMLKGILNKQILMIKKRGRSHTKCMKRKKMRTKKLHTHTCLFFPQKLAAETARSSSRSRRRWFLRIKKTMY